MDGNTTTGLRPLKSTNVWSSSPNPTQFREEILLTSWCLGVRRGHRTLTRGRNHNPFPWKTTKTSLTSYCILLGNLHPNWMKLRYLQQGTASHDEGTIPLVTIPSVDKRALHNSNRPRKPYVLESSQETRPKTCLLACRPGRIQLRNGAHPRKYKRPSRRVVTPTRDWQGREWQSKHRDDSPTSHQNCRHIRSPIRPIPKEHSTRTPRSPHRQTPWKGWNTPESQETLSMAKDEPVDHRLHQGMRHLPTEQNPDPQEENPDLQNNNNAEHETIFPNCPRPNHRTTPNKWKGRNTNYSGPRMF